MNRFKHFAAFCITLAIVVSIGQVSYADLVLVSSLGDAWAVDKNGNAILGADGKPAIIATAANGFVHGNDIGSQGTLSSLLNATSPVGYLLGVNTGNGSGGVNVVTSSTGMFSTNASGSVPIQDGDTIDLLLGTKLEAVVPVGGVPWTQVAQRDVSNGNGDSFFTVTTVKAYLDHTTMGPLSELAVISLKQQNGYAVYAFDLRGIQGVYGFGFKNLPGNSLSHATLFTATGSPLGGGGDVPEPSSLAIFGLGGLGLGLMGLRRRKANRQSA